MPGCCLKADERGGTGDFPAYPRPSSENTGRFGGHVEESYIGDHISRLLPDGYAAHTLRHRFATTAYAATHDLFVVAELLGHESVGTTEHYVAMPDGRLREATAAVRLI